MQAYKWDQIIWELVSRRTSAATYLGVSCEEMHQVGRLAAVEADRSWRADGGRCRSSWVYQQVHFQLGDYLRSMGQRVAESWDEADEEIDMSTVVLVRRSMEYLRAQLPDAEWTLLWMKHAEGRDCREIADVCGVSQGAVWTRLCRARKSAVRILAGSGIAVGHG